MQNYIKIYWRTALNQIIVMQSDCSATKYKLMIICMYVHCKLSKDVQTKKKDELK